MTIKLKSAFAETPSLARRKLLGAVALAPALAAAPALASIPVVDRRAWDAAFKAHRLAVAEDDAFTPIYERIHEAWKAGRPSNEGIHWKEFPFENRDVVARTIDLDSRWNDFLAAEGKTWCAPDPEARKARYRAPLDSVQAYRDAEKAHNQASGMADADERWEALGDRVYETRCALMEMPAPDLPALKWKLDHLLEVDSSQSVSPWAEEYVAQTRADIARLMTGEA